MTCMHSGMFKCHVWTMDGFFWNNQKRVQACIGPALYQICSVFHLNSIFTGFSFKNQLTVFHISCTCHFFNIYSVSSRSCPPWTLQQLVMCLSWSWSMQHYPAFWNVYWRASLPVQQKIHHHQQSQKAELIALLRNWRCNLIMLVNSQVVRNARERSYRHRHLLI